MFNVDGWPFIKSWLPKAFIMYQSRIIDVVTSKVSDPESRLAENSRNSETLWSADQ